MKKINSIYIIDDDRIIIFGIRKMLKMMNLCDTINAFANGKLAFDSIQELHNTQTPLPDVIFLDLNMPIMDGWQFLEELIALPLSQKLRINITTSSIDPIDLQNFEQYQKRTIHTLSYHRKPLKLDKIEEITRPA